MRVQTKYENPTAFITSQWQHDKTVPNVKYLFYRILIFLIFFITWILSMTDSDEPNIWPIFLTNWGYTLCTLQALLSALMLSVAVMTSRFGLCPNLNDYVLNLHPLYWICYTIATPLSFGITIMYWTIIHSAAKMPVTAIGVFVHGINSLLMFCDLWIVSHPVRFLHFIYPGVLGVTYTLFSIIYYLAGGKAKNGSPNIYPILKWDNPGQTSLSCLGALVFVLVLHFIVCLLSRARQKIHNRMFKQKIVISKQPVRGYDNTAMATENV